MAMPLYEFHCGKCEKDFELLVPTSKWEGTPCPHCGSKKLEKKLSTFAASVNPISFAPCDAGPCPMPARSKGHAAGCGCCRGR